jgi:clan AA aspartic protease (TIGR02281 family)
MRVFTSVLFLILISSNAKCFGQIIKSKDNVTIGKRSDFISSCTKGADKELMNINGLEIETYKYCSCVCDNLIPTINSWEMEEALKENKITELFLKENNLKILMECLEGNYKIKDDYKFGQSDDLEFEKKIGVINCVNTIMSDDNKDMWTKEQAEQYCECAINKLFSEGYTYKEILQIDDVNSSTFNEIALPCVSEVLKTKNEFHSATNSYNFNDIEGGSYRSLIPLTDYFGNGYKVKITIAGVTKYYLFDTGASDLIIDRDTERELLLNGTLKRENYLNKTEYTLANNQTINAQLVKIDHVVIGDYTLNNVVIAIIDEGSLLCGKSFLDKFKKWEIDKPNNVLILYK